jgi:hypothetical protein
MRQDRGFGSADSTAQIGILFLAANPQDTPRMALDVELREIRERLCGTPYEHRFRIDHEPAIRIDELQPALCKYRPTILHISAHGQGASSHGMPAVAPGASAQVPRRDVITQVVPPPGGAILIADKADFSTAIDVARLGELIALVGSVRCVVLNACFSAEHCEVLRRHVDCVIGMEGSVEDPVAITFSGAFYQALGFGHSIGRAFEYGRNRLGLERDGRGKDRPYLLEREGIVAHEIDLLDGDAPEHAHPASTETSGTARCPQEPAGEDFERDRELFERALSAALQQLDLEANDRAYFEPLLVEIDTGSTRRKRVAGLIEELPRIPAAELALLLGAPGAGKSVALRELAVRELAGRAHGRIPLYVSLEGWRAEPSSESLHAYVLGWIRRLVSAPLARAFIEQHFDRLLRSDGWLVLLDGFDEIPALLDATGTDVVRAYSSAVAQFAAVSRCPVIVASRTYRHPQLAVRHTRFRLVPFSERQMNHVLARAPSISPELRHAFLARSDLVNVARTPFFLRLARDYLEQNQALPATRSDLFRSFIQARIDGVATAQCPSLMLDDVCAAIARQMFHSGTGFEVDARDVQSRFLNALSALALLHRARLVRYNSGGKRIAFAHRRFGEYFTARGIAALADLGVAEIMRDTRWHEVIALRCEVAGEDEARAFAEKLFVEADAKRLFAADSEPLDSAARQQAVNVLRFLRDAFATRPSVLAPHRERTAELASTLPEEKDVFRAKAVTELVTFMPPESRDKALLWALACDAPAVQEAAFRSARHLGSPSFALRAALMQVLLRPSIVDFFERWRDWIFVLGLNPSMTGLTRFVWVRLLSMTCLCVGTACLAASIGVRESSLTEAAPAAICMGMACIGLLRRYQWNHLLRLPFFIISYQGEVSHAIWSIGIDLIAISCIDFMIYLLAVWSAVGTWRAPLMLLSGIVVAAIFIVAIIALLIGIGYLSESLLYGALYALGGIWTLWSFSSISMDIRRWLELRRVDQLPMPRTTADIENALGPLRCEAAQLKSLDRVLQAGVSITGQWSGWHTRLGISQVSSRLVEITSVSRPLLIS